MRTSLLTLAIAALGSGAAIDSQLSKRDGQCGIKEAPGFRIGGSGGHGFCESHWPGADVIVGLKSWSNDNVITAIEVRYSSGQKVKIGGDSSTPPSGVMNLSAGERITSAWMTGNGIGTRLGSMHIETSKGAKLDFGKVGDGVKKYDIDVGTGFLVGVDGFVGTEIDALALLFLKGTLEKVELANFKFTDDINKFSPQMRPSALDRKHYWNGMSVPMTAGFSGGGEVLSTYTFQQAVTNTFGVETKFEAKIGIPEVADFTIGTTIKFETSEQYMQSTSVTRKVNQGYNSGASALAPNTGIDCEAYAAEGMADFPYVVDVILHLGGGSTLKYSEKGVLHSVMYSETDIKCKDAPQDRTPSGFSVGKLTVPDGKTAPVGPQKTQPKQQPGKIVPLIDVL